MLDPSASASPAAVCAALKALAEHELTLVQAGTVDELDAIHERRMQLLTELGAPGSTPLTVADKEVLRQAARLQMLAREAMRQRQDELTQQLSQSTVARRAAEGYRKSTGT